MEEIIKEAAESFSIRLRGYSKSKTAFLLDAECGPLILKKQESIRKIEEQYTLTEALHSAGFTNTEKYLKVDGKPYATLADGCYTLSVCGSGGKCGFADANNAASVAKAVARLHNAAGHLSTQGVEESKTTSQLYYDKRLSEARRIKKWLNKRSRLTDIDVLIIKKYDCYLNNALTASHQICRYIEGRKLCLCVGEFKEDGIFLDFNKNVTFLNLENFVLSVPSTDLCKLIMRFIKRGGEAEEISQMISAYAEERELSMRDMDFMKAYFLFPHKFFAIISKYYNGKKPIANLQSVSKLKAETVCYEKILKALNIT